jgi:N-acetylglucosamine kinase-like BadF-type ATPase
VIVLGVDAGGTKTVCQLADDEGRVLAEVRGPSAHLPSLGPSGVEAVLGELIGRALAGQAGRPAAICLGMAGVDQPREAEAIRRVLASLGQHAEALVVNDALIALEAGAPGQPGVVVVAGTGSIAYGRDAAYRAARTGGWGYVLADEGSGFWLGRQALRAVVRAEDRRGRPTALTARVLAHYGVARPKDLAREVYQGGVKPSAIAKLAADVEAAAAEGDAVAIHILEGAAAELALMAESVVARLDLPEGPIVLAGGIFKVAPRLAAALTAELSRRVPRAPACVLDAEPAHGAVLLALALAEGRLRVPEYVD